MPTVFEISEGKGEQCEIALRGDVVAVMRALVSGLPREALVQFSAALQAELAKRSGEASGPQS